MPYPTLADLPDAVKKLPKHAQEIYQAAFNSAFKQYDGDEGKAAGTAWAAVKMKYRQDAEGNWIAKESKEGTMLSDKNKSKLLQTALVTEYKIGQSTPIPKNLTIEEVFDDRVIYDVDGQLYESSYELDGDGKATFGEPKKVLSTKVFKPMESLQITYSEIIQEAGKRNAARDSKKLKEIMATIQELLSDEEPDEKVVAKVAKEAKSVLTWLREQPTVKAEEGSDYPMAAFAYAPNSHRPGTWQLRMWEDLDKKVTKAQLGRIAAALSPGGLRGHKATIPEADMSAVKRKIRAEYRKLNVEDEDIPRWVKETETREEILNYVPLAEATFDKGKAHIVIIKAGFNATKDRYYPKEVLQRDYGIFEGLKMYADHPTETEEKERPERSIREWVATLNNVTCDESGTVEGDSDIIESWLMQKLALLRDKKMLSEMGVSINAVGHASKATIDGVPTLVIETLERANSVDFVTEPGAGGEVTFYESDRLRNIDLLELATLKERRPDLLKIIESNIRAEITKEVKKAVENEEKITALEGQITTLTKERDDLKEAAEKAEKDKAKAEAQAVIKEAVDKAELPDAAKERLTERFKDAESADGIEEAITFEKDYIAKLSEAGKVKGLGPTSTDPEKDKEALKESFKRDYIAQGKSEEEAEKLAETAASGR